MYEVLLGCTIIVILVCIVGGVLILNQHKKDRGYEIKYKYNETTNYHFWLSIKKAKDCLFSRRNGYQGKIIFGYSIRLRLFNKDII